MRAPSFVVAAATLLFAACTTEYTYEPPTTADGKACVARCQRDQNACRMDEQERASDAQQRCRHESARKQEQCEHDAQIEYEACLKYSKADADRAACKKAACSADSCYVSASTAHCEGAYRTCFQSCGGKIGVLK